MALGTLLLSLLALELAARALLAPIEEENVTAVPQSLLVKTPYPGLRFRPRPNGRAVQEFPSDPRGYFGPERSVEYALNSLGLRGPEVTRAKLAGARRVVALGDSVLFGTGVREDDVLTAVLQRELEARGLAVEVLNFSCPAYDTLEEALLFQHEALALEPDLAFFLFFLNDAVTKGGVITRAFNETGERAGLRRASVLVDHLAARLARRRSLRELEETYRSAFADGSEGWKRIETGLRLARAHAAREGVSVAVVLFPLLHRLDDYPFRDVHAKVARTAEELGYDVLDLLPVFAGRDGPALWVHPTNQHPNEVAHALAGRAIAEWLAASGHLDGAR